MYIINFFKKMILNDTIEIDIVRKYHHKIQDHVFQLK